MTEFDSMNIFMFLNWLNSDGDASSRRRFLKPYGRDDSGNTIAFGGQSKPKRSAYAYEETGASNQSPEARRAESPTRSQPSHRSWSPVSQRSQRSCRSIDIEPTKPIDVDTRPCEARPVLRRDSVAPHEQRIRNHRMVGPYPGPAPKDPPRYPQRERKQPVRLDSEDAEGGKKPAQIGGRNGGRR
uniref:Uncharacterized protein n=1 Tax=Panagrellus redivivus TaxID=6233 RepID=A0A7E4ZV98_PANRE